MTRYWQIWVIATFATFIIPETWALLRGRPKDTLSETTWRWEKLVINQPIQDWTATHFLFAGILAVFALWLVLHLTLGILR